LVQRIALFSTPVSQDEILATYPASQGDGHRQRVPQIIARLRAANLLITHRPQENTGIQGNSNSPRVTAHTLVRNHVLQELGDMPSVAGEAQRFELTGWSGGVPETLAGRGDSHRLAAVCVDALLDRIDRLVNQIKEKRTDPEELKKYRNLIRAAFGLMRSRWTATAIPRLYDIDAAAHETDLSIPRAHYDDYQKRLAILTNAIRLAPDPNGLWLEELSAGQQNDGTNLYKKRWDIETKNGLLYADELLWLYNEQAMVAFCQGFTEDAAALLNIVQTISSLAERGPHGHRWCESEITLGLVQMEMGDLTRGRAHLENVLRVAGIRRDFELRARARGHLALSLHLQGHYEIAQKYYKDAIGYLNDADNLRAVSIFRRHYADLLRMQGKFDDAREELQNSVAAAQSGRYPDLVQYSRIAQANFALTQKEQSPDHDLTFTLEFAHHAGIPKLEWEAQNVQARIAIEQGEFELAEKLAISNLAIASALGLKLRLARSLCRAGEVAARRGNHRGARSFFHSAHELAARQRYQLLIEQTEQLLNANPIS
jgi:tetratricopeptide (TPR) repeat protein